MKMVMDLGMESLNVRFLLLHPLALPNFSVIFFPIEILLLSSVVALIQFALNLM